MMTYNPVGVTMCYCRQQLKHNRFDFRLQEWMGHIGQKSFKVMLNKRHHNKNPAMIRVRIICIRMKVTY